MFYFTCNESKIYKSLIFLNKLQDKMNFFTIFIFFRCTCTRQYPVNNILLHSGCNQICKVFEAGLNDLYNFEFCFHFLQPSVNMPVNLHMNILPTTFRKFRVVLFVSVVVSKLLRSY